MENIASLILNYEKGMVSKLLDSYGYTHNHPPVSGIESSCLYCKIHGNVFSNGVQSAERSMLRPHVIPITNGQ